MRKFKIDINNLTLRSCGDFLPQEGDHYTAELVRWLDDDKTKCYTIGCFEQKSEGFDFRFVGMRPLHEDVNKESLMELIRFGYRLLGEEDE